MLLTEKERKALKIKGLYSREELILLEKINIEQAYIWLENKKLNINILLSEAFILQLHKKMYCMVWRDAGIFRKCGNEATSSQQCAVRLKNFCNESKNILNSRQFSEEESSLRFMHGLLSIRCFSNGNARHACMMADLLMLHHFKKNAFSWNGLHGHYNTKNETDFLQALKYANEGNFAALLFFAQK